MAGELAGELRAALPGLPPQVAIVVAGVIILLGLAAVAWEYIDQVKRGAWYQRMSALVNLGRLVTTALANREVRATVESQGTTVEAVQAAVDAQVAAQQAAIVSPTSMPRAESFDELRALYSALATLYQSGDIGSAAYNAAKAFLDSETMRLSAGVTVKGLQEAPELVEALLSLPPFTNVPAAYQFLEMAEAWRQSEWISQEGWDRISSWVDQQLMALDALPVAPVPPAQVESPDTSTSLPVGVDPEIAAAIAALEGTIAQLRAENRLTQGQNDALSSQIAALTTVAGRAPAVNVDVPDTRPALGVLAGAIGGTGALTLTGSLTAAMSATAGPNAHSAQMARYDCQGSFLTPLLNSLSKMAPQMATATGLFFQGPLRDGAEKIANEIIKSQLDMERFAAPADEDQALTLASQRLVEAIRMGLQAQMLAYSAEAITPLKQMGVNQLAGFLGELAGFKRIADGLNGTVETAAIYTPLKWAANRRFRPMLPTEQLTELMYQKRSMTLPELQDVLARQGLEQWVVDRIEGFIFNDPRLGELVRVFQLAEPGRVAFSESDLDVLDRAGVSPDDPDAYYKLKLAKAGYDDTDVVALVPAMRMGILRREQTLWFGQVERLARDGYITEARARVEIEEARKPAPLLEYRLRAMRLQGEYEQLADVQQLVMSALGKGLITGGEATSALTSIGMDPVRVRMQVLRSRLSLTPRNTGQAASVPDVVVSTEALE